MQKLGMPKPREAAPLMRRPAIERGRIVLCDRFVDSSRVYQGASGGLDPEFMADLERVSIGGMMPDLTLILDIDPADGLRRASARRGSADPDRFEKENRTVHERRRAAFLEIARREPGRCVVIDAAGDPESVGEAVEVAVLAALDRRRRAAPRRPTARPGGRRVRLRPAPPGRPQPWW